MENSPSLGSEAIKSTGGKILMAIARFGGAILFANLLNPYTFGAAYVLLRFGNVLSQIVLGWADAVKKRIAGGKEEGRVIGVLYIITVCWIGFVGMVLFAVSGAIDAEIGIQGAALLLCLVVASESIGHVTEKILEGRGRIGTASFTRAGRFVLALPIQTGLLFIGYGVDGFIGGLLLATILVGGGVIILYRLLPEIPDFREVKKQWSFAKFSAPNALVGTSYGSLDVLLLTILLSSAASGYYEAAWTLTMPSVFVASSIGNTLMTQVSARKRDEKVVKKIHRSLQYSSIIAIPLLSGVVVIGTGLIRLVFGTQFIEAAPLLIGLAVFQLIRTQVIPLLQSAYGLGHPEVVFRVSVAAIALNLIGGVIFIKLMGPVGVVLATIIAESVRYGTLKSFITNKVEGISVIYHEHVIQILAAIVMGISANIWIRDIPLESDVLRYGSAIIISSLIYSILVIGMDDRLTKQVASRIPRSIYEL